MVVFIDVIISSVLMSKEQNNIRTLSESIGIQIKMDRVNPDRMFFYYFVFVF